MFLPSSFSSTFSCLRLFLPLLYQLTATFSAALWAQSSQWGFLQHGSVSASLFPCCCVCLLTPQHVSKSHAPLSAKRAVVSCSVGLCASVRLCPVSFHTTPESEEEHDLLLSKKSKSSEVFPASAWDEIKSFPGIFPSWNEAEACWLGHSLGRQEPHAQIICVNDSVMGWSLAFLHLRRML